MNRGSHSAATETDEQIVVAPLLPLMVVCGLTSLSTGLYWQGMAFVAKHIFAFSEVRNAVLYIVMVFSVWVSPGGAWIAKNTGIGRLWVFPPGAMVIIFFLYFNYMIHLLLVQCRDRSEGHIHADARPKLKFGHGRIRCREANVIRIRCCDVSPCLQHQSVANRNRASKRAGRKYAEIALLDESGESVGPMGRVT